MFTAKLENKGNIIKIGQIKPSEKVFSLLVLFLAQLLILILAIILG